MKYWAAVGLLIAIFQAVHGENCKGCLNLDEASFIKIIPKFKYSLVKYDVAYPYGAKHDAFVKFADDVAGVKDLVVGEIGIKDYGPKDNEAFAMSQQVDAKKLPAIKLYKGLKEFFTFPEEDVTVEKLRAFVLKNTDIHITLPGCLEELDKLAHEFTHGDKNSQNDALSKVEEFKTENEQEKKIVKSYLLYMKKLMGDSKFAEKEKIRLNKILTESKLAEGKKIDLQHKLNILHSFDMKNKDVKLDL